MILFVALLVALPADVTAFADRHTACVRLVGEEIEAAERMREIEQEARAIRCDRLGEDEAALRRRHAGRADVIARLDALHTPD